MPRQTTRGGQSPRRASGATPKTDRMPAAGDPHHQRRAVFPFPSHRTSSSCTDRRGKNVPPPLPMPPPPPPSPLFSLSPPPLLFLILGLGGKAPPPPPCVLPSSREESVS